MSMYVDLLAAVLADDANDALDGDLLVESVITSRARMLSSKGRYPISSERALAYELAYDRALITLCAAGNIAVDPRLFARPGEERARLERALADAGMDVRPPEETATVS